MVTERNGISGAESVMLPFGGYVMAGFPSPASDYTEDNIDLMRELVPHPVSTFYFRAVNDSMIDAHIPPDAILIVDKVVKPHNWSIVIASVNGEFVVKYFIKDREGIKLVPANKKYKTMVIREGEDFAIWGVVTGIVIQTERFGK